jgi:hypothetical protein
MRSQIKQLEPQGKVDTSVHSALLGLLVGESCVYGPGWLGKGGCGMYLRSWLGLLVRECWSNGRSSCWGCSCASS